MANGRINVTLRVNKRPIHMGAHRLVLLAFLGPCPEGMEACHKDGNPTHNVPNNLYWGTKEQNWEDRRRHGHDGRGEQSGRARLTAEQVVAMRNLFAAGLCYQELAREFRVGASTVLHIIQGHTWTHVSGPTFHIGKRRNRTRLVQENHPYQLLATLKELHVLPE